MTPSPYNSQSAPPIPEAVPTATYAPQYQPAPAGLTGDGTGGVIPFKNPKALTSYYIGLFSLIPVFGLIMAPAAVVLGIQGLKYAKQNPIVKGQVHAWVGIVCGGFWTLVHFLLVILTLIALVSR